MTKLDMKSNRLQIHPLHAACTIRMSPPVPVNIPLSPDLSSIRSSRATSYDKKCPPGFFSLQIPENVVPATFSDPSDTAMMNKVAAASEEPSDASGGM